MKKLLLIVNPCAGKKKANPHLTNIISVFNHADYEVTVHVTAQSGEATTVAAERGSAFDLLVCIGGDGTFNEVITGADRLDPISRPVLGYIPAGSTNDFANSLHLDKDPVEAARNIVKGKVQTLDIGKFNGRCFSYIASFGAFTHASYATPQNLKNLLGHTAYLLESVKELTSIRSHHVRFTTEDGRVYEDDYIFGAISNSTSVAGVLTLDPQIVDMNDGLLELLLVRKPHSLLELSNCIKALGTHDYDSPMLTLLSTPSVKIEAPEDMDWTLDGEFQEGSTNCSVVNCHSAINIIL